MTKKVYSRAIAVVLVAAMCMVAVFTGAVSAETTRTASCSVTGYGYYQGAKDSYVTAEVTFSSSEKEFVAGSFTASATGLSLIDCSLPSGESGFTIKVNPSNGKVVFMGFTESSDNDIKSVSNLTLLVKFTVTGGALSAQDAGTRWTVNISGIDITNTSEETYTCANASGTIHVHQFDSGTTSGKVTTKNCQYCTETQAEINNDGTLGSNTLAATRKANLTFTKDGDTVLNALVPVSSIDGVYSKVYFVYKYKTDEAELQQATSVSSGTMTVGGTPYYVFPCGRNGGIGRMGRDITGNFIAVTSGGTASISTDWTYSVKTYLETLIIGNDAADANYAKALWNFGKYTAEALNLTTDAALFGTAKSVTDWFGSQSVSTSADKNGTDSAWNLKGVTVTTGYKPKMNLRFSKAVVATVKVYDAGELVYSKEVTLSDTNLEISDIPTKYITGDVVIGVKDSIKTYTYGFGRYAKAQAGKPDGNVFKWMMNYAYYLNQKYA